MYSASDERIDITGPLPFEQRMSELFWIKRLKILRLFSKSVELCWNAQFSLHSDNHAALASAIEFGDDESREWHRFIKLPRLVESIHSGGRIQNEKHLVRRARQLFVHDSMHFL